MPPIPFSASAVTFEQITGFLAYWTAAGTFAITAFVLILTVIMIRGPIKENTRARKQEDTQKRLENALELMKIAGGVKALGPSGPNAFLQLCCIEALSHYPEYHAVYRYMLAFYKTLPQDSNISQFVEATERLVSRTAEKA